MLSSNQDNKMYYKCLFNEREGKASTSCNICWEHNLNWKRMLNLLGA